jgi:hypothetical protein
LALGLAARADPEVEGASDPVVACDRARTRLSLRDRRVAELVDVDEAIATHTHSGHVDRPVEDCVRSEVVVRAVSAAAVGEQDENRRDPEPTKRSNHEPPSPARAPIALSFD